MHLHGGARAPERIESSMTASAGAHSPHTDVVRVPVVGASRERLQDVGLLIGTEMPNVGLPIPHYRGSVVEGYTLPFVCFSRVVVRTAQVHERGCDVHWLERHVRMTQIFLGLGDAPFAMVLGKPSHGSALPDPSSLRAYVFPPGHGVMLHLGTWHEFPMVIERPVTVLTISSEEVVEALSRARVPAELDANDVLKIDVVERLGVRVIADISRSGSV